MNNIIL